MVIDGSRVVVEVDNRGIAEVRFDSREGSVNTLDAQAVGELRNAVDLLRREPGIKGLLLKALKII